MTSQQQRLLYDLVKCPICRTPIPDTADDKREHLRHHERITDQINYLKDALDHLEGLIPEGPAETVTGAVAVAEWHDTEDELDEGTDEDEAIHPAIDRDDAPIPGLTPGGIA